MSRWRWAERTTPDETTRLCACGASFTWEGFDDRLDPWMKEHEAHMELDQLRRDRDELAAALESDHREAGHSRVPPSWACGTCALLDRIKRQ